MVLGMPQSKTSLKAQAIELPVKDKHKRDMLLAATMVDMGEKTITTKPGQKNLVVLETQLASQFGRPGKKEHWPGRTRGSPCLSLGTLMPRRALNGP